MSDIVMTVLAINIIYFIVVCRATEKGVGYRGTLDKTSSGARCQRWDKQKPYSHSYTPENYPNAGLQNNYCRNPSGSSKPWCYTVTSKRWAYCDVPMCNV